MRLTDKISLGKYGQDNMELFGYDNKALPNQELHCSVLYIFNKLGYLEDIEDGLGIEMYVREQAFENGFYGIDKDGSIKYFTVEHYVPYLKEIHTRGIMTGTERRYKLCDYGKTWALTKRELEND